ncbi:hypothetical protein [Streptomyces sp. NPDC056544]|uniref:hypothetical protein n=1 Tax=unclassified Streptomyces TaxID=2593676 RepID=UPI0036B5C93F
MRVQDHCAGRLRGVTDAVLEIAASESFDDDLPVPVGTLPAWFPRAWAWWDLPRPPAGADRLRLWADTRGEPFFAREDLRRLRHACGARTVADPVLAKPQVRVDEVSA